MIFLCTQNTVQHGYVNTGTPVGRNLKNKIANKICCAFVPIWLCTLVTGCLVGSEEPLLLKYQRNGAVPNGPHSFWLRALPGTAIPLSKFQFPFCILQEGDYPFSGSPESIQGAFCTLIQRKEREKERDKDVPYLWIAKFSSLGRIQSAGKWLVPFLPCLLLLSFKKSIFWLQEGREWTQANNVSWGKEKSKSWLLDILEPWKRNQAQESCQRIILDVHEQMDEKGDMDICAMKFCPAMESRAVFAGQRMKRELMSYDVNESHKDKCAFFYGLNARWLTCGNTQSPAGDAICGSVKK